MTRSLLLISLGSLIALGIYWFGSLLYLQATGGQLLITPFKIVGPNAKTPGYGESLAEMLESRLAKIQGDLSGENGEDGAEGSRVTPLIFSQPVNIPAEFRRNVDFQVNVGGVEVGGLLAWLRETLYERRALTFTLVEHEGGAVVSANLGPLVSSGDPHLWMPASGGPDAIVSQVAYSIIQRKFAEQGAANVAALNLDDFRLLVDSLAKVERLNRKAKQQHLVDDEFAALLAPLEKVHERAPNWHALTYLLGNISESSGNRQKALYYYTNVRQHLTLGGEANAVERELARLIDERVAELGESVPQAETLRQEEFLAAAREFARLLGLSGPSPAISFRRFDVRGQQGQWNGETRTYEVSLDHLETPGLPQYVALTGRFMDKNFERCFGASPGPATPGQAYWNEFRYSVVDYLIHSVPEFKEVNILGLKYPLFRVLGRLEARVGKESVKRLALELLTRYECDWSQANIADRMTAIVKERGLAPAGAVAQAFEEIAREPAAGEEP